MRCGSNGARFTCADVNDGKSVSVTNTPYRYVLSIPAAMTSNELDGALDVNTQWLLAPPSTRRLLNMAKLG